MRAVGNVPKFVAMDTCWFLERKATEVLMLAQDGALYRVTIPDSLEPGQPLPRPVQVSEDYESPAEDLDRWSIAKGFIEAEHWGPLTTPSVHPEPPPGASVSVSVDTGLGPLIKLRAFDEPHLVVEVSARLLQRDGLEPADGDLLRFETLLEVLRVLRRALTPGQDVPKGQLLIKSPRSGQVIDDIRRTMEMLAAAGALHALGKLPTPDSSSQHGVETITLRVSLGAHDTAFLRIPQVILAAAGLEPHDSAPGESKWRSKDATLHLSDCARLLVHFGWPSEDILELETPEDLFGAVGTAVERWIPGTSEVEVYQKWVEAELRRKPGGVR